MKYKAYRKKIRENPHDLGIGEDFLEYKAWNIKEKIINCTSSKYKLLLFKRHC